MITDELKCLSLPMPNTPPVPRELVPNLEPKANKFVINPSSIDLECYYVVGRETTMEPKQAFPPQNYLIGSGSLDHGKQMQSSVIPCS